MKMAADLMLGLAAVLASLWPLWAFYFLREWRLSTKQVVCLENEVLAIETRLNEQITKVIKDVDTLKLGKVYGR